MATADLAGMETDGAAQATDTAVTVVVSVFTLVSVSTSETSKTRPLLLLNTWLVVISAMSTKLK